MVVHFSFARAASLDAGAVELLGPAMLGEGSEEAVAAMAKHEFIKRAARFRSAALSGAESIKTVKLAQEVPTCEERELSATA